MDPFTRNWVKDDYPNPQDVDDEDLEEDHDDIPPSEQDPPPASSSAQPSTPTLSDDMFSTILSAITSLSEEFRGFRTRVDDVFERVNNNVSSLDSRMSRM